MPMANIRIIVFNMTIAGNLGEVVVKVNLIVMLITMQYFILIELCLYL